MSNVKRTPQEEAVDKELIALGRDVIHEFDESEAITIKPKKRESKLISIRLPLEMMQALRDIAAKSDDAGYQRIIKRYIAEGLQRAQRNKKEDPVFQELESQKRMLELQQRQISELYDRLKLDLGNSVVQDKARKRNVRSSNK